MSFCEDVSNMDVAPEPYMDVFTGVPHKKIPVSPKTVPLTCFFEFQRRRVDAITHTSRWRAVGEDVAEVSIAM